MRQCDQCYYREDDDEYTEGLCAIMERMDEDDLQNLFFNGARGCPYYHPGDGDYALSRAQ